MKRLDLAHLGLVAHGCSDCSDKAPSIPLLDTSTLEAPVAQGHRRDTVEELRGSPKNSQYWANYAEVLQAHQLYEIAQVAWGGRLGSGMSLLEGH